MTDLSIIIVNYNTRKLLDECLESIGGKEKDNPEIIVIDNASSDNSVEFIKQKYKSVCLTENKENLGFSKANNQGIKVAKGEYVLLLNSDTITNKKALEGLVEFAKKHPNAGVVGARLLNDDNSIQPSVFHLPSMYGAFQEYWLNIRGSFEKYVPKGDEPVEVEAIVGAAFLIPKKMMEQVGLLDERYFMYFEDLDYCRRVKRAGYKIYYLPQLEIIHHHGSSGKDLGNKTSQWLIASSKIYHGQLKYWLLTFIIWMGQKLRK